MTRILSAFEAVRPRGTATAPAAVAQPRNRGKAPSPLPGSLAQAPVGVMVMDRTGKRIVHSRPAKFAGKALSENELVLNRGEPHDRFLRSEQTLADRNDRAQVHGPNRSRNRRLT